MKIFKILAFFIISLLYSVTLNASNTNKSQVISKRASEKSNNYETNNVNKAPVYDFHNKNRLSDKELEERSDSVVNNLLDINKNKYNHHTVRFPIVGFNIGSKQSTNTNGDEVLVSKGKSARSLSASYLYSLSSIIRLGPEVMRTTYNNTSNVQVNDSISMMLRGEVTLYKNSLFDIYALGGVGVSFNNLNLIYTKLALKKVNNKDRYSEVLIKPLMNGSSVPSISGYSYCSLLPQFLGLNTSVVKDDDDSTKGTTNFTGYNFGTCAYKDSEDSSSSTIAYQDIFIPKSATSVPWFIGAGIDYNFTPLFIKLFYNNVIDTDIKPTNSTGISASLRYFNNGVSTVRYRNSDIVDQYSVSYKGYFSFSIGLYLKF